MGGWGIKEIIDPRKWVREINLGEECVEKSGQEQWSLMRQI